MTQDGRRLRAHPAAGPPRPNDSGAQALTFAGPGETALAGAVGTILSASSLAVISNGTLRLDNTVSANNANRLGTMQLTLAGGTFSFSHDGGAANFSEAAGALVIGAGTNTVFAAKAANGQTSAMTFASLACAGKAGAAAV